MLKINKVRLGINWRENLIYNIDKTEINSILYSIKNRKVRNDTK